MQPGYRTILEALDEGRRRLARARLTSGLVRVGGVALAAVAGAILWAALQKLLRVYSVPVATAVSLSALGLFLVAAVRWLLLPLHRVPRREQFVHLVERRYPGERNLIVNAYELGNTDNPTQGQGAPELVDAVVARAAARVGQLDLRTWRDPRPDRPFLWAAGAGIAAVALLGILSPSLLVNAGRQVVRPELAQAPPVTLEVTPGNIEVERGSDVPISVDVAGTGKRPVLRYRERNGSWRSRDLGPASLAGATRDGGAWQALLPDVDRDLEYALRVAGAESPLFTIQVREPLRLSGFQIHLRFPTYSRLAPETITAGTGDVAALRGTDVDLRILANRSLAGASLEWRPEGSGVVERRPLVAADSSTPDAASMWRTTFRLLEAASYAVVLEGENGEERWRSPTYRVEPVPDRAPFLTLHFPQEDHDLTEDLAERVVADAADDFGFSACRLVYRVDDGAEQSVRYAPFTGGQTEFRLDTLWDLAALSLLPGSTVSWYLEVLDNDTVSGPKAARSPIRRVRFPTVSEIYEDVAQDHDREIDNLARLQDSQEDLHKHLEKLEEELKRGREMNYDLRQDVERSLDQQRELERQLTELVSRLEETVNKASNRAQMNQELVQKMAEINQLLENLQDEDMKRSLEQLAQSLSRMDRNAMREALEAFQTTQQEMLRGMERTIELLKQVRREEQVEDVVRRTDEIAELEQQIAEELQRLNEEKAAQNAEKAQKAEQAQDPDAAPDPDEARDPGETAQKGPEDPELPEDAITEPRDEGKQGDMTEPNDARKEGEKTPEGAEAKDGEKNSEEESGKQGEEGKDGETSKPEDGKQGEEGKEGKPGDKEKGEKEKQGERSDAEKKQLAEDMEKLAQSLKDAQKRLAAQETSDSAASGSEKGQKKDASQDRMSQLSKDQERAQELLEELRRTLETLKKLNQDQPDLAENMEEMEASQAMKNLKRNMEAAQAGMKSQAPQKASKYAFEARDQANSLAGMARNMQMQMQSDQDDEVIQMVERLIEGLIELSGGEESLVMSTEHDDRILARRQFNLGESAEALAESLEAIGKKSLRVSEDHQKRLSGAVTRMDRATRLYEEGNRGKGAHEGRESASDLNETIVTLMQSHAEMCQSKGGGTSSEQMKQKMQSLSEAQQGLNRSTREMMERLAGKPRLSMTEAQRLGQLAAQQEMIRQGLEQAMQDHEDLRELLGNLDSVKKEMEEVEETLRQSEADPRLLDRQEKILSRLLDAQRSVRQQEMSPERESRTGTLVERRPPPPLPEHLLRSERTLEEDVLRGADDRYPSQYRKLVEAYFRALSREGRNP